MFFLLPGCPSKHPPKTPSLRGLRSWRERKLCFDETKRPSLPGCAAAAPTCPLAEVVGVSVSALNKQERPMVHGVLLLLLSLETNPPKKRYPQKRHIHRHTQRRLVLCLRFRFRSANNMARSDLVSCRALKWLVSLCCLDLPGELAQEGYRSTTNPISAHSFAKSEGFPLDLNPAISPPVDQSFRVMN